MSSRPNACGFQIYCNEITAYKLLTIEEERGLSQDIKRGGKNAKVAKEKLVKHNLRLVIKIANGYKGMGLDIEDLVSEGNTGLHEAAKRYDHEKGAKFSSYSSFWIKQRIRKALSTKSRTIKVPICAVDRFNDIKKYVKNYELEHDSEPTQDQIAKKFNMPKHRGAAVFNGVLGTVSLDTPSIRDDSASREVHEIMSDDTVLPPDVCAQLMENARLVEIALQKSDLTTRERFIIENRFGLHGRDRTTLEKIGVELELTRERIRQIEEVALWKIKNFFEENRIT